MLFDERGAATVDNRHDGDAIDDGAQDGCQHDAYLFDRSINQCHDRMNICARASHHKQHRAATGHISYSPAPSRHVRLLLAGHGIRAERLDRRLELRPILLVALDALQVPFPHNHRLFALPHFQKCGRPERHENRKEHRRRIVEQVRYAREQTRIRQQLVFAGFVAQRTQRDVAGTGLITDFLTAKTYIDDVFIHANLFSLVLLYLGVLSSEFIETSP